MVRMTAYDVAPETKFTYNLVQNNHDENVNQLAMGCKK